MANNSFAYAGEGYTPWMQPCHCPTHAWPPLTWEPYKHVPSTAGHETEECGHCGKIHQGPCPRVKAIEYFENGVIRRVEYHG